MSARQGEPPRSLTAAPETKAALPTLVLPPVDVPAQLSAHEKKDFAPKPLRFALPHDLAITPASHGRWTTLPDGELWQLRLTSDGATDVNFGFETFQLPPGATLHLISFADDPVFYDGPYTAADHRKHGQFWSAPVPGGDVAVEIFVPTGKRDQLKLELSRVSTGFRDVFRRYGGNGLKGGQGSCNNDVVCPEGNGWRDEIRSVAAYTISGTDTCTGTLIMDTERSFRPWFLTAWHCSVTAGNAAQMVTIWNYEAPVCGTNSGGSRLETVSGATFRASRRDVDSGLVELSSTPPESFNVYYAGWDRSGNTPGGSVGIHHPRVAEKSISFNTDPLTTVNNCIGGGGSASHWEVNNWEDGTTEPGSSGSAIFDPDNKLVVGFLSGGSASCTSITSDCYGKFSEGWDNGGSDAENLAPWLDPNDTGVMMVPGANPTAFAIAATPEAAGVCAGESTTVTLDLTRSDPAFSETVTLSLLTPPAGIAGAFAPASLTAPGSSQLTLSASAAVAPDQYPLTVVGTGPSATANRALNLTVSAATPGQVTLTAPNDSETSLATIVSYTWTADANAASYLIEVATDAQFTNIVDSATVNTNSYESAVQLNPETSYFWRVTASNGCGSGTVSSTFSFATSASYCLSPNVSIPDNSSAGVNSDLVVGESGTITGMTLALQSDHTWPGDLVASLSHNSTTVTLMDRPGTTGTGNGCNRQGIDVVFDDSSATPVEGVCEAAPPAVSGTLAPEQPLSAFSGANINGTWRLNVSDNVGQDTGLIQSWCLNFSVETGEVPIFANGFE
ncbi:MAG: proprotein convertase P-domain-containing protein [Pseudomonadota bacterium]